MKICELWTMCGTRCENINFAIFNLILSINFDCHIVKHGLKRKKPTRYTINAEHCKCAAE